MVRFATLMFGEEDDDLSRDESEFVHTLTERAKLAEKMGRLDEAQAYLAQAQLHMDKSLYYLPTKGQC